MAQLFDRVIQVTFGPATEKRATQVEELFMQFDIKKSLESEPSEGTVEITNLSPKSQAILEQKKIWMRLKAGYRNPSGSATVGNLFVGQVKKAATERHGRNTVTTITCMDGIEQWQNAKISRTLAPGATTRQVIEALAEELKVGVGSVKGLVEQTYQQGISLFGPVKDRLDEVVSKMGLEWSILDNNLVILGHNIASEKSAIVISPDTGLIESPVPREDDKTGGKFVEFECLIRPGINPGVAVKVESRRTNGFFKIRKANFKGDNRKGPFSVKCEAVELGAKDAESTPLNVNLSQVLKPNL